MPSQAEFYRSVIEAVSYDADTGRLTWRRPTSNRNKAGSEVGASHSAGYRHGSICGHRDYIHRWVWFIATGEWPDGEIDHINGDRLDNRLSNLRRASRSENAANTGIRSNNRSGFKGVCWHKRAGKWVAGIRVNGKPIHLGLHSTKEEAAAAYNVAAERLFGEFARTNDGAPHG